MHSPHSLLVPLLPCVRLLYHDALHTCSGALAAASSMCSPRPPKHPPWRHSWTGHAALLWPWMLPRLPIYRCSLFVMIGPRTRLATLQCLSSMTDIQMNYVQGMLQLHSHRPPILHRDLKVGPHSWRIRVSYICIHIEGLCLERFNVSSLKYEVGRIYEKLLAATLLTTYQCCRAPTCWWTSTGGARLRISTSPGSWTAEQWYRLLRRTTHAGWRRRWSAATTTPVRATSFRLA